MQNLLQLQPNINGAVVRMWRVGQHNNNKRLENARNAAQRSVMRLGECTKCSAA
jgi:hypothetical protein